MGSSVGYGIRAAAALACRETPITCAPRSLRATMPLLFSFIHSIDRVTGDQ